MGKLILFKVESGSFIDGFDVTLQICDDNPDGITHPFTTVTGTLPPCQPITNDYQTWQESYRSLHQQVRLGSPRQQITHITDNCQESAQQLKQTLSNWYHCQVESFGKIRERLLAELDTQEIIRLLIQTEIKELHSLPWHLFFDSFLNQYIKAELAISPVQYNTLKLTERRNEKIKILAIFGNSEGVNLQPDREVLTNLQEAEIITLIKPSREDLFYHLYKQEWDLFFFAGHSGKNEETGEGKLYLNEEDIITIEEFNNAVKQAIQKGLKLAVFNSCDGLGLAQDLVALHLSQIVVMTEIIPDKVAHVFIREFLTSFAANNPLYLAVRQAREKLQPLENQFPCATWLPIICQNPASLPLTWQSLQPLEINSILSSQKILRNPENLANLILETRINNTQLTLEYNSLINPNVEVLVNYTDTDLSMSEDIARMLLTKGGKTILKQLEKQKVKQLGQILTTNAGKLRVESIFHCVIYDYQQPELTDFNLVKTIINRCLTLADSNGFSSLAFPVFLPHNSTLSIEQITIAFAQEITNYLEGETHLQQVKVILQNTSNLSNSIVDERLYRFYGQFKEFLELTVDIKTRCLLLQELSNIYQQRQMRNSVQILTLYQDYLTQFKQDWINNNSQQNHEEFITNYHESLENISQKISHNQEDKIDNIVTSVHQNYHEEAAQIWQELVTLEDDNEIISLLDKLGTDIDGFAWINDQYELSITSAIAKQRKINEMLQNQVKELEKGQELLQQKLLNLYSQGILNKKTIGEETSLIFKEYPKINIIVEPEELPLEYRVERITYTPNKRALKEANNQGIDISNIAEIDPNLKPQFKLNSR